MRFLSFSAACLFASLSITASAQSAPTCTDLHVVPAVRECKAVEVVKLREYGPSLSSDKGSADEAEILQDLSESIHRSNDSNRRVGSFDTNTIVLLHADNATARKLLTKYHLSFDPAMHDEGYVIVLGQRRISDHRRNLRWSVLRCTDGEAAGSGSGKDAVLLVPTIRDWPAMPHRGISDDWSRGPLPNMEFLKREIRTLAAYKLNIFSPYFEHTFAYASTPVAAFPGGAMTPEEGKELVAYAAKYHITIIPEQEAFGHLHHVLKFEEYSKLGETPHGSVLAPGDPASLPLIGEWFGELAKVFPGPYAHIGADETDRAWHGTHPR